MVVSMKDSKSAEGNLVGVRPPPPGTTHKLHRINNLLDVEILCAQDCAQTVPRISPHRHHGAGCAAPKVIRRRAEMLSSPCYPVCLSRPSAVFLRMSTHEGLIPDSLPSSCFNLLHNCFEVVGQICEPHEPYCALWPTSWHFVDGSCGSEGFSGYGARPLESFTIGAMW